MQDTEENLITKDSGNMGMVISALEERIAREPNNKKIITALGNIYFNQNNYLQAATTLEQLIRIDKKKGPEIILQFERILAKNSRDTNLLKALIKLHLAEGSIPEVLGEISEYLDLEPQNKDILGQLLKISHEYKKTNYLLPVLEKAYRYNLYNSSLLEVLAGIYLKQNNHLNAIKIYEETVNVDERNVSAWSALAELYIQHGNYEKGFNAYKKVMELSPRVDSLVGRLENLLGQIKDKDNVQFLYLLAAAYIKLNNPDRALAKYAEIVQVDNAEAKNVIGEIKNLLKAFPDYPEANFLLAKAATIAGSYTEAVATLNKILKFSQKYIDRVISELNTILKICPTQVLALQSLADIYLLKGDYRSAVDQYSKIIDLVPEEAEKIVEQARKILDKDPKLIKAREIIAKYYLSKKQYRKAIAEAEAIIAILPNHVGAYLVLGRAQLALGENDFAFATLRMAISLDPYQKETHFYYQEIMDLRLEQKIGELSKAILKDPWKYSLHYDLGYAYFHKGALKEAIGEFQLAVRDAGKSGDVHKMLGICFKEEGRYDLAIEQFEKALDSLERNDVPNKLRLLFYIGLANEAEGRHQDALQVYEEIMTQDMNYENIQIRMEKLKSFSWTEIRGKALAAIIQNNKDKKLICSWAKNSESEEFSKKHKNKNVDLSFSLEHNNKAVEHTLRGRFAAAEEELVLAEQMDPQFTVVQNNKGVIALIKGDYKQAKEYFARAQEINKKLPIVFANSAVLYHIQGDREKALQNYEKSLALDNSMFITHINLGDLYYEMDEVQKAIACWERALNLGVVPELAKRRLKYKQL